jgi:hypothetical protein
MSKMKPIPPERLKWLIEEELKAQLRALDKTDEERELDDIRRKESYERHEKINRYYSPKSYATSADLAKAKYDIKKRMAKQECSECALDKKRIAVWAEEGGHMPTKLCTTEHKLACYKCDTVALLHRNGMCEECWKRWAMREFMISKGLAPPVEGA